jgi:hypothetical protein
MKKKKQTFIRIYTVFYVHSIFIHSVKRRFILNPANWMYDEFQRQYSGYSKRRKVNRRLPHD